MSIHFLWIRSDCKLVSYFAAYELTKKAVTPSGYSSDDLNLWAIVFAGGMAGVAMWSIAIPPDVCLMYLEMI